MSESMQALLQSLMHPGLKAIDLSLGRVEAHLAAIAHPERKLPSVVHVAGTNGKGSTIAFIRAALEGAGYRCHVYTSPHLVSITERFVLAGVPVSEEILYQQLQQVRIRNQVFPLTYFEALTVAAFELFAATPADICLLEVGMGGRFDATNVVTPLLSVITPVGLDHQAYLGTTLGAIAYEKAGIIKHYVPCVLAHQDDGAEDVIRQVADERASAVLPRATLPDVPLGLAGAHQRDNATTALTALHYLQTQGFAKLEQPEQHFIAARWPARLQKLEQGALVEIAHAQECEIWLDSGHNGPAAVELARWITAEETPVHLVFSMSEGHAVQEFLAPLAPVIASCHVMEIPDEPLSQSLNALRDSAQSLRSDVTAYAHLDEAVRGAVACAKAGERVLITGSLYLAGRVLEKNS